MRAFCNAVATLCLALMGPAAIAQQDLEPAVQTSPSAAPAASAPNPAAPASPAAASGHQRQQQVR